MSTVEQPVFPNEDDAHEYLQQWISSWFRLEREVHLRHVETGNRLRVDFLATPEPWISGEFPFDLFGIEVKANTQGIGNFNKALKQAIDYTSCEIIDKRPRLAPVFGCRLTRAYVFPAPSEAAPSGIIQYSINWHGGSERLAGLFRVGLIYRHWNGDPEFRMSAERQWSTHLGGRSTPIHTRTRLGSGVIKRLS